MVGKSLLLPIAQITLSQQTTEDLNDFGQFTTLNLGGLLSFLVALLGRFGVLE